VQVQAAEMASMLMDDLWYMIAAYLPKKDRGSLALASRRFRRIVRTLHGELYILRRDIAPFVQWAKRSPSFADSTMLSRADWILFYCVCMLLLVYVSEIMSACPALMSWNVRWCLPVSPKAAYTHLGLICYDFEASAVPLVQLFSNLRSVKVMANHAVRLAILSSLRVSVRPDPDDLRLLMSARGCE
jgi:hypothetical protein